MDTIPLKVMDETLRDGEQQAGLFFPSNVKRELAHLIAGTGVQHITIMPMTDDSEAQLVQKLVGDGLGDLLACSTMTGKRFIDHSKACGIKRITLFHSVSDRLMFLRDNETRRSPLLQHRTVDDCLPPTVIARVRANAFDKIMDNLRYATSRAVGLEVDFAAEDASRADFDFLTHCIREFRPYIGHFLLCDTVGVLSPDRTHRWIYDVMRASDEAPLAVHFHNDLGMAVENTIQAVLAGATMVSGTFCGIGERAGNAALEQVLFGLRERFGVEVQGIDYDAVDRVVARVKELGGTPAAPYSKEARRHETGIHVNSLLRDPRSYSNFSFEKPEVWFGKFSGASNFQYLFENRLKTSLDRDAYNQMRIKIKALSIKEQRCFSGDEVIDFYERGLLNGQSSEEADLLSDEVSTGRNGSAVDVLPRREVGNAYYDDKPPVQQESENGRVHRNGSVAHT